MIPLIICSIIAIIGITLIIISFTSDDEGFGFAGFIILLFDSLLGFGLCCCLFTASSTEIEVKKFSYAKAESVVLIQTPQKAQTFSDAHTFNSICDSSKVYLHVDYNSYGYEIKSHLIVK